MSSVLDYWPFDYQRYFKEILPALRALTAGNLEPVQNLLEQVKREKLPVFKCWNDSFPIFISNHVILPLLEENPELTNSVRILDHMPSSASPIVQMAFELRKKYLSKTKQEQGLFIESWSWELLQKMVPLLASCRFGEENDWGVALHLNLLYAFCGEYAPDGSCCLWNDEAIWRWQEYACGDQETYGYWKIFRWPFPATLERPANLPIDEEYLRALSPYRDGARSLGTPMGFATLEETRYLYTHLSRHRSPFLVFPCDSEVENWLYEKYKRYDMSWDDSLWELGQDSPYYQEWARANPDRAISLQQQALKELWEIEDELFRRLEYAVTHNWGMLMCYRPGG